MAKTEIGLEERCYNVITSKDSEVSRFRTIHKQLKDELAKAKADVEEAQKGLADAKNVMTSKDSEVSTLKEEVKCVLKLFVFVVVSLRMRSLVCVCLWLGGVC